MSILNLTQLSIFHRILTSLVSKAVPEQYRTWGKGFILVWQRRFETPTSWSFCWYNLFMLSYPVIINVLLYSVSAMCVFGTFANQQQLGCMADATVWLLPESLKWDIISTDYISYSMPSTVHLEIVYFFVLEDIGLNGSELSRYIITANMHAFFYQWASLILSRQNRWNSSWGGATIFCFGVFPCFCQETQLTWSSHIRWEFRLSTF